MTGDPFRLAVVALHPIQYQAGLWRALAAHPRIDLKVIYLDRIGIDGSVDPTMKGQMKWDVPLLDGYSYEFVRNLSPFRFTPIVNRVNPALFKSLRARRYDAVVVHGYLTLSNWLVLLAAKATGMKTLCRAEGSARGRTLHDGAAVNLLKHPLNAFFLRRCDAIACSSEDNRRYHLGRGAPADRLFPMPCAVDNEALESLRREAPSGDDFRRSHGLPCDVRLVTTVGRFAENKCTSDCLDAFATATLRSREDVHLALVGDGPLRGELERQARELGIEKRVHFIGFLNQSGVVASLMASDLFLLASNRDPSPKALSEALYLGLPIVCSDGVGTSFELVHGEENGLIYPCRDSNALAEAIDTVLGDPGRMEQMGQHSHEIALKNDFRVGVESLVHKLDEMLDSRL